MSLIDFVHRTFIFKHSGPKLKISVNEIYSKRTLLPFRYAVVAAIVLTCNFSDLATRRLEFLKQLFLMTENQDRFVEYIENFDVSSDNMVKLNDYLDQHKLRY
jgi:hypothetical protein